MESTQRTSVLKKTVVFLVSVFVLLLVGLATLPLWFNIDSYRPLMVSVVEKNTTGKLSLGKLSLSAWGKVKINVNGFELKDSNARNVISAKSVYAEIPVLSLISRRPKLSLILQKPSIFLEKDSNGNLNILALLPKQPKDGPKQSTKVSEPVRGSDSPSKPVALPVFILASELNLFFKEAQVSYLDSVSDQKTTVNDITVEMQNVSFEKPFDIFLRAELNSQLGKTIAIRGPLKFKSQVDAKKTSGQFWLEMPGLDCEGKVKINSIDALSGELAVTSKKIDYGKWLTQSTGAVPITNLVANLKFQRNGIDLTSLGFQIFGGRGKGTSKISFATSTPKYSFDLALVELDLNEATSSQFLFFKNMFKGKVDFKVSGRGESFETLVASRRMDAAGSLRVREAKFLSLNLGQIIEKGLGESLVKIFEQVPLLRGKPISKVGPIESEYDVIQGDFTIQQGVFNSPNFEAKAKTKRGLDFKGATRINIETCALNANWQVIDTYNLTRAHDVSVEQNGIKMEHILARSGKPVAFPILVEGTCQSPKVNYEAMTSDLLKVALDNAGKGLAQKAKQEITKKIGEELQKGAAKPIQDALKGIFGK